MKTILKVILAVGACLAASAASVPVAAHIYGPRKAPRPRIDYAPIAHIVIEANLQTPTADKPTVSIESTQVVIPDDGKGRIAATVRLTNPTAQPFWFLRYPSPEFLWSARDRVGDQWQQRGGPFCITGATFGRLAPGASTSFQARSRPGSDAMIVSIAAFTSPDFGAGTRIESPIIRWLPQPRFSSFSILVSAVLVVILGYFLFVARHHNERIA